MTYDTQAAGAALDLAKDYGIDTLQCMRDEMLVLGLKQAYKNLANPSTEEGPLDKPTKGLVLLAGPLCTEEGISPGTIVYFPKFTGEEIDIRNRKFFVVNMKIAKLKEWVSAEKIQQLASNSY